MKKVFMLIILSIIPFQVCQGYSKIEIKYKIGDEIVTNLDILDERKYLIFLRPSLKDLKEKELSKIAENSIIREIIKKKELNQIFKDVENSDFIEVIKKNLFKFKKVKNESEFKDLLNKANIDYDKIILKMKYEAMWNELIFQKYSSFIKIDKKTLSEELKTKISKNKKYEYNLSEILFELEDNEILDEKYKEILKYANNNNFKNAAAKFSISNSSVKGGQIGWIKETLLSEVLIGILATMKKNDISNHIKYPNGYLILKINDRREMKQIIDVDRELNEMSNFERNRQLNQFSMLFYKKLKQNITINEY
tara:strand:+ start:388 stop:1314 length:927 start_codon:yes stop_codon:yes gene_type:complete